jgi:hypothetical protein
MLVAKLASREIGPCPVSQGFDKRTVDVRFENKRRQNVWRGPAAASLGTLSHFSREYPWQVPPNAEDPLQALAYGHCGKKLAAPPSVVQVSLVALLVSVTSLYVTEIKTIVCPFGQKLLGCLGPSVMVPEADPL